MTRKRMSDLIKEGVNPENPLVSPDVVGKDPSFPSDSSRSRLTKAELEKQVLDLTQALAEAQKSEEEATAKMTDLGKTIEDQNNHIKSLEYQLNEQLTTLQQKDQAIQDLQGELDTTEQKKAGLADRSGEIQQLTAQLEDYQALQSQLAAEQKLVETLYGKLQRFEKEEEQPKKANKPPMMTLKAPSRPTRYVAPKSTPTLSDSDIGWFD